MWNSTGVLEPGPPAPRPSDSEDSSDEDSQMEKGGLDKEKMLALLRSFSTPIDPNNITSTYIEALPSSRIHSSSNLPSRIHSNGNLHSCANSNGNVTSYCSSSHAINYPQLGGSFHPGSVISCATSASITPMTGRKFKPTDSDAGTDLLNTCRICHLPGGDDDDDLLFSPCRCSGTLKYVHYCCLLKWIEISTRKNKRLPKCELCNFMYIRHKRFKFHNWRMPRVSRRDKCLHIIFILTLVVMLACAVATILCFLSDNGQISQSKSHLSVEEVITLTCGVLFFVCFFLAMTVEIKARHTVYRLFLKFIIHNTEWQIEPYDKAKDPGCPKPFLYT